MAEESNQELPGSVSDQNSEEAEPGHGGSPETRRRPAGDDEERGGSEGESSEGTQSTGNPDSAG